MAGDPRGAQANVVLLGVLALEAPAPRPGTGSRRNHRRERIGVQPARTLLGHRDQLVVVDGARGGDDDVRGHVAGAVKARDLLGRRLGDDRGAADDRPAQWIVPEHGLAEEIEDLLLGIVLVHGDLLEDHRPLGIAVANPAAIAVTITVAVTITITVTAATPAIAPVAPVAALTARTGVAGT